MALRSILLSLLLAGPGLAPAAAAQIRQGLVKPIWISALPHQEGRVYAMGMAPFAPEEAKALTQAAHNARVEVLSRLRASVRSDTEIKSSARVTQTTGGQASGRSEQQVGQTIQIKTQATDLPGLVVEETWPDGPGQTAYALAYLDIAIAERELRTRFSALKRDLFQESETPEAPRQRLRMLARLRAGQVEIEKLDDMAALLGAGGGDPQLRSQIRSGKLSVDRQMDQLRGSLTLSLEPGSRKASEIGAILRNAALKAGLGWSENDGEFQLAVEYQGDNQTAKVDVQQQGWNGYWRGGWASHTVTKDSGIVVARGVATITLKDKHGTQYESVDIEAKGLGVSNFQADQRLKEEFRKSLESTFGKWLNNLVK